MAHQPHRFTVRKRHGKWRIYDHNTWHDTTDTLTEAHTWATQLAIITQLCTPGGLTKYTQLTQRSNHQ